MDYIMLEENVIISIIKCDETFALQIGALPWYAGAEIGQAYSPPPASITLEEAILDKLTGLEYRQDLVALGLAEGGAGV